jgi:hypothetical protein
MRPSPVSSVPRGSESTLVHTLPSSFKLLPRSFPLLKLPVAHLSPPFEAARY